MPQPPPFPIRADDLTVGFLSDALQCRIDGFVAERVGADRGMLGEVFVLRIDSTDRSAPESLVAKFASLREGPLASARRGRNNERELRCYEDLLADTPVRTPAFYGSWYDEATAHYLLLQEAIDVDTRVDQIAGLTIAQAEVVIDEMAALHARWWLAPELLACDWLPRLDAEQRLHNLSTLSRLGWEPLRALVGDDLPPVPPGFGDALPGRIVAAFNDVASLPHTLIHCDLRADNLLFDPVDGAVTLVDWQGCGVGPAGFDLAYFLTQSLTIDDRRGHEAALIDRWRDGLARHGVEAADPLAGFDKSLWFSMAVSAALPVISDPDEPRVRSLARAMATRTLAAMADHGQLENS